MPNKMLIDATHPEETRVVVLRGNRVEEFDFESANRKQLRGNIYLAKVTRVEPSLQAAFVDYGGNRHGFLAFSEIHPDYYQIPVADRQALIAEEEREQRAADAEADHRAGRRQGGRRERPARRTRDEVKSAPAETSEAETPEDDLVIMAAGCEQMLPEAGASDEAEPTGSAAEGAGLDDTAAETTAAAPQVESPESPMPASADTAIDLPTIGASESIPTIGETERMDIADAAAGEPAALEADEAPHQSEESVTTAPADDTAAETSEANGAGENGHNITEVNGNGAEGEEEVIESVGGADAMEEVPERPYRSRRQYKIQEVIKRRQVMLVQVVKEERGTKGAALTTYLSLAGRYSVLMPNTARGGGISRKITAAEDRRKLKEIAQDLEVPEGMGVILRTAGAARTKTEVKRDFEYLLRLWETVRDLTLRSTAPMLVYEEGSLVKRSIRDLYNKDIDEIIVAGEDSYREAKDFMRMLMPSHTGNVKRYTDTLPVFTRYGIESQLDAMFQPVMQLRSGGYIVINQTEALVAIDVNSGRATREHHIEDTALKTNMEAAEEIARQLRLRDLAGLIVIDFIDMDEKRNNRAVERKLKECLRHDRARIQVGHISHFGLLEMSRQRIRSSVLESSTEKCPHCGGTGHMRSVSSVALQLLRAIDEMLLKGATHNLVVRTRTEIALYLLNQKRGHLRSLEERFRIVILVNADATIGGQVSFVIEKGEQVHSPEQARALAMQAPPVAVEVEEEEEVVLEEAETEDEDAQDEAKDDEPVSESEGEMAEAQAEAQAEERPEGENGNGRKRRRRRGRRGERRDEGAQVAREPSDEHPIAPGGDDEEDATGAEAEAGEPVEAAENGAENGGETNGDGERRRRRRGRRGGRRNRRERDGETVATGPENGHADEAEPEAAGALETSAVESVTESVETVAEAAPSAPEPAAFASHEPPAEQRAEPPAPAAEAPEPAPAPDAPRRRSTVREPVPVAAFAGESIPTPLSPPAVAPPPVIVTSTAEEDRPRRSGWWAKRALGKD
jgi:ribonuclease E